MQKLDTLSARFKYMLSESHLTQDDFGKRLGFSPNYMSLIIDGKRDTVSGSVARLIEALYGFNAFWVLTGEDEPRTRESIEGKEMARKLIEDDMAKMDNVEINELAHKAEEIIKKKMEHGT